MENEMNNEGNNDRRSFLKTAGAALVAASMPVALTAQSNSARPGSSTNNIKQLGLACHPVSVDSLPGIFGQVCYNFQMFAEVDGTGGGFGTLADPVFPAVNSHIKFYSGRTDANDIYIFQGTVANSLDPDLVGKPVTVKVKQLGGDNCDLYLTIGDTPVQSLLLPAVQKVREAARR
jgi:hypothetical protein